MNITNLYIGCDPGADGCIAVIYGKKLSEVFTLKNKTEQDVFQALDGFLQEYNQDDWEPGNVFAVIEKVQPMPRSACGNVPMFKLGQSYGFLRGLLIALHVPFDEVRAHTWQKYMGLAKSKKKGVKNKETMSVKKGRHKAKAQQLFPSQKITLSNVDGILLADYCRRIRRSEKINEEKARYRD